MARRNANLAGLAALGALGYKLANSGSKSTGTNTGASLSRSSDEMEMGDDQYNPDVKQYMDDTYNPDIKQRVKSSGSAKTASGPSMMSREEEAKIRATGGPRGTRYLPKTEPDMSAYKPRRSADQIGAPRQVAGRQPSRAMSYEEKLAQIPGSSPEGWTGGTGEPVTGNEITRNLDAMMLGRGPTGITQMGRLGAEALGAKGVQRAYNARAAARRANEGLSDAETAAVLRQRALSEADTTGGAVGYKKGGAVKAKAKKLVVTKSGGKVSSASKRADGIAMKGKTRGKLY